MIINIFSIVFLLAMSIWDIKEQKIPITLLLVFIAVSILIKVYCLVKGGDSSLNPTFDIITSLLPGAFLIGTSKITCGKVGYGDGLVLLGIGVTFSFGKTFLIFLAALLLCAITGGIIMLIKKSRRYRLPFVPFLLAGTVFGVICL